MSTAASSWTDGGQADLPLAWDPHVHSAPSSTPRWGDDLDLVDAAHGHGLEGFVLKSHHETTASRAAVANSYARRQSFSVTVVGSVVLNPWITVLELERAIALGARIVWWPTRGADGATYDLPLPDLHNAALDLLSGRSDVLVATGHLGRAASRRMVSDARARGLTTIATHPLSPEVGVGPDAIQELVELGAYIEVDAYSLHALAAHERADHINRLAMSDAPVLISSDGGQLANGDPFAFLQAQLADLIDEGVEQARLVAWLAATASVMRASALR